MILALAILREKHIKTPKMPTREDNFALNVGVLFWVFENPDYV